MTFVTLSVGGLLVMPAVIAVTVAPIMAALADIVLLLSPASFAVAATLHRNVADVIGRFLKALLAAANSAAECAHQLSTRQIDASLPHAIMRGLAMG